MKAFLPTALFINLSVATLMVVGLTSNANAAQKVQGFSVENCRPLNDKAIMIDFCSPQAIGLYKQQLSRPINFNRNYVLFPIDLPKSVKGWGKVTNYAALNPKTKQVIPMSFAFFADQGYARLNFSKNVELTHYLKTKKRDSPTRVLDSNETNHQRLASILERLQR